MNHSLGGAEGQADLHLEMGTAASNEKGRGPMHTLTATHSQALGLPLSKLAAVYASRPFSSYHHAYSLALNPETPTPRAIRRSRPRACMLGRGPPTAEPQADLAEHSLCWQPGTSGGGWGVGVIFLKPPPPNLILFHVSRWFS